MAALDISSSNTMISSGFGKLLEPGLRKIFFDTYNELPEQFSQVFHMKSSQKAQEHDYGVGGFPTWSKRANGLSTVDYQKIDVGLERVYTHNEFSEGFIVERKFVDDEQYGAINKMPASLARAGRASIELDAVSLFANAFTEDIVAEDGLAAIYDGKALCANDHPTIAGGVGDNLTTGALSDANLKIALQCMRETVDETGRLAQFMPDVLLVPPELEFVAIEILNSTQKSGGQLNDINAIKGRLKVQVWDFLTDPKAWFVLDSKRHEANFFWRVRPEFKHEEDFDTFAAKYRGYMRYSYGVSDWRGIVGSTGL